MRAARSPSGTKVGGGTSLSPDLSRVIAVVHPAIHTRGAD